MGCGSSLTANSRPSSSELSAYSVQRGAPQWELEAERVHKALEGFSVDETIIVGVLARFKNGQRQKLRRVFKEEYGEDLLQVLSSRLSGSNREAILALLHTPASYDAQSLHSAVQDEDWDTVTEIVASRDSDMLEEIREVYLEQYSASLDDDLCKVEPVDLKKLLMSLSKVDRQFARKKANKQAAVERAHQLHRDKDLVKLLCEALSKNQLRQTFSAYEHLYRVTMKGFIKVHFTEWTEPAREALKAYVTCLEKSSMYFAKQIKKTVDVLNINESKLIRIAVSRSEKPDYYRMGEILQSGPANCMVNLIASKPETLFRCRHGNVAVQLDLYYIRKQFLSIYGKSLAKVIRESCDSDFAEILTTIITVRGQYSESAKRR